MKTHRNILIVVMVALMGVTSMTVNAEPGIFKKQQEENKAFTIIKGKVIDEKSSQPLVFATIAIVGTNIATVSNADGQFLIKVPKVNAGSELSISFIGYDSYKMAISELKVDKNQNFRLNPVSVAITEISVFPTNARVLISKVLENKRQNYSNEAMLMTGFYRESIKKRRTYVGLSEAVVQIYKQPYNAYSRDLVRLLKGRKGEDVTKMDTLLFKLQGGPYSTLMLDVIKDPYLILAKDVQDMYEYSFQNITRIDGKLYYVIDFKQRAHISEPMFYGQIFINTDNYAVSSIVFNLNTENKEAASQMYIKKRPLGVKVHPTSANYMVNYREQDGKYYFSYARGEVAFKVNWKKKLLNTTYTTAVEMAITDREVASEKPFKSSDRLKMNTIMSEAINGFADANFWGQYNVIEPDQTIESAIKKIKKNLDTLEE